MVAHSPNRDAILGLDSKEISQVAYIYLKGCRGMFFRRLNLRKILWELVAIMWCAVYIPRVLAFDVLTHNVHMPLSVSCIAVLRMNSYPPRASNLRDK